MTTLSNTAPLIDPSSTDRAAHSVIVVGSGLAGASAAIEAARSNPSVRVFLLEKEPRCGGNSEKASSGINAVRSPAQEHQDIADQEADFINDTLSSGKGRSDKALVEKLARESRDAILFLESFGVNLEVLSRCGGHSQPRTHRAAAPRNTTKPGPNIGFEIMSKLLKSIREDPKLKDSISIITNAHVTRLLTPTNENDQLSSAEPHAIIGVEYEARTPPTPPPQSGQPAPTGPTKLFANAVILATGGYGQDRGGLLKQYAPQFMGFPSTNGKFATGDGISIAAQIGANLVDLDQVQIHPTGFVNPEQPDAQTVFLAPEALRAAGGILLNHEAERFVDELGTRDAVSVAMLKQCKPRFSNNMATAVLILNEQAAIAFQKPVLDFYASKKLVQRVENATALANRENWSLDKLRATFQAYEAAAQDLSPDPFGKKLFPVTFSMDEPLYTMYVTPSIHYTMGGVQFNVNAQVLDRESRPIPGLYAAGEVTGGLHGMNRLAGNSLLECVVFGRTAGRNAAQA